MNIAIDWGPKSIVLMMIAEGEKAVKLWLVTWKAKLHVHLETLRLREKVVDDMMKRIGATRIGITETTMIVIAIFVREVLAGVVVEIVVTGDAMEKAIDGGSIMTDGGRMMAITTITTNIIDLTKCTMMMERKEDVDIVVGAEVRWNRGRTTKMRLRRRRVGVADDTLDVRERVINVDAVEAAPMVRIVIVLHQTRRDAAVSRHESAGAVRVKKAKGRRETKIFARIVKRTKRNGVSQIRIAKRRTMESETEGNGPVEVKTEERSTKRCKELLWYRRSTSLQANKL